jgi:hypothetical protein
VEPGVPQLEVVRLLGFTTSKSFKSELLSVSLLSTLSPNLRFHPNCSHLNPDDFAGCGVTSKHFAKVRRAQPLSGLVSVAHPRQLIHFRIFQYANKETRSAFQPSTCFFHQHIPSINTLHPSIHSTHSTSKVFNIDFVSVICFCISNKQAKRAFQRSQPAGLQLPSVNLSNLSCLSIRTPLHKLVDSYQILVLISLILSTLSIVFLGVVCCLRNRELVTKEERLSKFSAFCISISQ